MAHLLVMVVMIWCKDQQIFKILLLFILQKLHTEFIFNILVNIKQKKTMNKFDLVGKTGDIYYND